MRLQSLFPPRAFSSLRRASSPSGALAEVAAAPLVSEAAHHGCGWFESSHELCSGLEVQDSTMDQQTFTLWALFGAGAALKH